MLLRLGGMPATLMLDCRSAWNAQLLFHLSVETTESGRSGRGSGLGDGSPAFQGRVWTNGDRSVAAAMPEFIRR